MIGLSDGATIAVVVLVGTLAGTLSPLILARMTNAQSRQIKEMDWKREDELNERKERLEAEALDRKEKADKLSRQQQTRLIAEVVEVKKQNKVIHRLVNSAYTASLAAQLVALEGKLMYAKQGDATEDELIIIQADVDKLKMEIAEREKQQNLIDREVTNDKEQ